jgi:THO complex subunit 2
MSGQGVQMAEPMPYCYEVVTDERVEKWQDEGRQAVLDTAKEVNEEGVSTIVQELVRAALDKRLDAAEAGGAVRQMIADQKGEEAVDVQSLFLNTISLLDDSDTKTSHLLTLVAATDIDPEIIRQELDIPLLQTLSLVRSSFTQMRTRKTTNILYRQANFNLLREESEGYAKLITEYFNTANEAVSNRDVSAEAAFQRIKALVGSFDLDVGRVLDITLDISANLLVRAYGFFVKFYRCSSWWPDAGVLDNVKWEDQGFGSFPRWAMPESERPKLGLEAEEHRQRTEREEFAVLKEARDVRFWERVRQVGMDAFYELGARKIVDLEAAIPLLKSEIEPEYDARRKEINADRRKRINENRKFMRETGLLPPPGNSDAAQLLGFKLRFYASDARDAQDTLPDNLIFLAALLIKIGFISLRDLYPHLYPADDKMPEEKARLAKEKVDKEAKERPGGGTNALAMAGALTDDTIAPAIRNLRNDKGASGGSTPKGDKKDEEPKEELPTPSNQKIMLLRALLLIGALPEALYILGRFPWLMEVDISLPPYLHRIATRMLSKVAESIKPLDGRENTQQSSEELEITLARPDGSLLFRPRETKKQTKWLGLDQVQKSDGLSYRHYYPEWDENIPVCQSVEDVVLLCNSFLNLLGVKIGQDVALLSTLVRIAKHSLTEDASETNRTRWLDLMKRLLVPALSLSKHNVGLTQEIYELLKFFPTTTRFNIYAEWYLGKTSRSPDMRIAFDHNRAEIKDVLRRVTNENGRKQARALAKVSLASPGIVTMSMITQLESYSNMIPSLVECTRYFSLLAYDVLTWCLIHALGGQMRPRMQNDGMLTSPWLQYLSHFVASLFYRYTVINPSPVLQYLAFDLRRSESTNLEMFDQVLTEMAGIRSDMEFNDAQVISMAGGEHLQAQTVMQLADKRYERKASAQRLIKALSGPGLIGQILIAIAQERQKYGDDPNELAFKYMPLKVLGNNLDKIQLVFAQYLDVLKTNLSAEEFEAAVPDIVTLVADFGLQPGLAFTICRTAIAWRISEFDTKEKGEAEERKRRLSQEKQGEDVQMADEIKTVANGDHAVAVTEGAKGTENSDEAKASLTPQPSHPTNGEVTHPWHPILEPIIQDLPRATPLLAERVSVPFFVTFWTLTLQDVMVSTESYKQEKDRLRVQLNTISMDRSDVSALALKERDHKKREIRRIQDKLDEEVRGRVGIYQKTKDRLSKREKTHWFDRSMDKAHQDARHVGLLQECFLPRAMLSSLDAHYCFLMLKMLHGFGTPGFSTMVLLTHLMKKQALAAIMFQCTAMEAQHFGRFLCETLKLLQRWHADKAVYDKEALGLENTKSKLHGFAKKLDDNGDPETYLDYEDFRRLLYNWHAWLSGALQLCFESGEYMHIRNGIIVLKSVVVVFPALNFQGHNMVKHVTAISQEDERQDLKLAAMSLLGPLRNREKSWIMPQAFRLNDPAKEGGKAGSRAPSARPETPQPAGTPKLSATAQEFEPSTTSGLVNGVGRKESMAGKEDGEIEDEKQTVEKGGDVAMKDAPAEKKEVEAEPKAKPSEVTSKEIEQPTSKAATPAPLPTKPPASEQERPGSARPSSTQPGRHGHDLPMRPDSRPPNKPLPAPPSDRPSGRYPGRSEDRYGRLDRPNDMRPGSRGHSPNGRSRARTPERDPYYGSQAPARGARRDERPPVRSVANTSDSRHPRDDGRSSRREPPSQPALSSRSSYESHDRPNGAMGPPSSLSTHPDRAGYINSAPDSAQPQPARPTAASDAQTSHHENPARLAMMNDDPGHGRDRQKDSRSGGPSSDDRAMPDTRPNGTRTGPPEPARDAQPRMGPPTADAAPTGPRRGRLSRDLSAAGPSESSYGRLNGPQDAPSGPRPQPNGPSGRGGRSFNAPQGPASSRPNETPLPTPSASRPPEPPAAPRGPSSRQQPDRRSSNSSFEQQPASNPVPPTSAAESGPQVHPSRAAILGVQPPPIQTNLPPGGPRSAASPTTAPPSGPRGPNRGPPNPRAGPSPTMAAPPSGPASAVERQRRSDRQRADINATLQGSGNNQAPPAPSVNFRGAAQNRAPSMPMSSVANTTPIQAVASSMEPPARRPEPGPPSRINGPPSRPEPRPDLTRGRGDDRPRHQDDGAADKQRGSRNTSRERRAYEEQGQRLPQSNEERSTRSSGRDDRRPRDDRDGPSTRDSRGPRADEPRRGPPDMPGSFGSGPPAAEWDRGGDRRGPRRDGPPDDGRRGGRGSTRPDDFRGGRREDERRPPPPPPPAPRDDAAPPGGRKRRHEDGPAFDESKRRRSGR